MVLWWWPVNKEKLKQGAGVLWHTGLNHDRGQTDVTIDLQDVDLLEVGVAVLVAGRLIPIDHYPEGVSLTADGQLKRKGKP